MELRRKPIAFVVLALFLCVSQAFSDDSVPATSSQTIRFSGTLLAVDGKPASDAIITVDIVDQIGHSLVSSTTIKPDSKGMYSGIVNLDLSQHQSPVVFAQTKTSIAPISVDYPGHQTILEPFTNVRVRLRRSDNGRPAARVAISPAYFIPLDGSALIPSVWNGDADPRWTAITDSSGIATVQELPQDYSVALHFADRRYIEPAVDDISFSTDPKTAKSVQTVRLQPASSVSGAVVEGKTNRGVAGVTVTAAYFVTNKSVRDFGNRSAVTGPDGHYAIDQLPPGKYAIEYVDGPARDEDWTAPAVPVTLLPGVTISAGNLALIHGAEISGRTIDLSTNAAAPQIVVRSVGVDHPSDYNEQNITVSDSEGEYSLRVAPGKQTVYVSGPNILQTDNSTRVVVADEASAKLNLTVVAPGSPIPVQGRVVETTGRPAAGAVVTAIFANSSFKTEADSLGRFSYPAPGVPAGAIVYAAQGLDITPDAIVADGSRDLILKVRPHVGVFITGVVKDGRNKPIPGASVELFRENSDGSGYGIDSTLTNNSGKYAFPVEFSHGTYSIFARHAGYVSWNRVDVLAAPGRTINVTTLTMDIANSFVAGKVFDNAGKPVGGALVGTDQNIGQFTQTDSSGLYKLTNIPDKSVELHIVGPSGAKATTTVKSGRDDDNIVLK